MLPVTVRVEKDPMTWRAWVAGFLTGVSVVSVRRCFVCRLPDRSQCGFRKEEFWFFVRTATSTRRGSSHGDGFNTPSRSEWCFHLAIVCGNVWYCFIVLAPYDYYWFKTFSIGCTFKFLTPWGQSSKRLPKVVKAACQCFKLYHVIFKRSALERERSSSIT